MNTDSFYYKMYQKKTSDELKEIIFDPNIADDTKNTAFHILETRGELTDDLIPQKKELDKKLTKILTNEAAQDKYSTFWRRFFAMIIDGIFLSLVGFLFKLYAIHESDFINDLLSFISIVISYLYSILFHGFTGQTIGKMITGVKIFDKSENSVLTFKQAFLRDVVPLSGILILYFLSLFELTIADGFLVKLAMIITILIWTWSILEIVTMLFNKKRRALHDFIAGTVVLKIKDRY